ncbi:alpha/beta fold hydrolase [Saccharothrix variisporea]|uniref:Pimeloyl-ACP methyl ester carboxylesterase n=1 Tax=Saccharothrix variisporea TaxID=543527 RepID=A0A495X1M2_9PSEU|nr:alpha/beta fold hydrolase [Saccharothrix variisporea]RKT67165.1 pimeloyl-ACP methyl ester carboxylesterase [Saccharothrix variisporea]
MPHTRAADGTKIAFDVVGEGDPLLLLSGQANARRWWDPIRADFAAGYRTIAVDAVGTGESDEPADGRYSIARFAEDVLAVLDELGVTRTHVYGTSMGGRIAQRIALEHPDRIGALVLGCTSPGGAGALLAAPEVVRPLALSKRQAREALLDLMFTPEYVRHHTGPYHVLGDPDMSLAARRGHKRASDGHDAWDELHRITAPTLVLHGSDDLFTPVGNAERLAARIPGAELVVVEGARHAYFEEFRAQATPPVLDFLARHPLA